MITNTHEHRTALRKLKDLETTLLAQRDTCPPGRDPEMHALAAAGIESTIAELRAEADAYVMLSSGKDTRPLVAAADLSRVLDSLGDALVAARIATGLSQQQLADAIGLHEGVIRRYERERYRSTSLDRLQEITTYFNRSVRPSGPTVRPSPA
jgi:DNA-binding XRE family transcriptional regulator